MIIYLLFINSMFKIIICPDKKDVYADNFELPDVISFPCTFHFKNREIVQITHDLVDRYEVDEVKMSGNYDKNFLDMRTDKAIIYLLTIPKKIICPIITYVNMFTIFICPEKKIIHDVKLIEISLPCIFYFKNGEILRLNYDNMRTIDVIKDPIQYVENFIDMNDDRTIIYLSNIPEKIIIPDQHMVVVIYTSNNNSRFIQKIGECINWDEIGVNTKHFSKKISYKYENKLIFMLLTKNNSISKEFLKVLPEQYDWDWINKYFPKHIFEAIQNRVTLDIANSRFNISIDFMQFVKDRTKWTIQTEKYSS